MKSRTPEVYSNFLMSRFYFSVYMCIFLKNLLNFPETPDKWKMMSTTTGTFINAGHYKVLLLAENMDGIAFDALDIQ